MTCLGAAMLAASFIRFYSLRNYVQLHPKAALGAIPFLFEPGNIAFSLAGGNGFGSPFRVDSGPTAWMTPVYPGILAGIFRLFGFYTFEAFLAAALLNVLFSVLTCIPLYYAAKRVGGLRLAALAVCLWAIFPNAIILPYEALWDSSLAAFLGAIILWATLTLRESGSLRQWLAYGMLWGFTLMTTAALGALLPFLLIWAGFKHRRGAILAGTLAIVCCVPWTVRNYMTFRALVPLRTVMGLSLWLGNNEQADGTTTSNLHPISNSKERTHFIEEGEIAYNRIKQHEAIRYMFSHPLRTARLTALRFTAIWSGGSVHPLTDFYQTNPIWFKWVLFFNLFASIAAAAGIVILYRTHSPFAFPVAVFPVIFPLAYYLTVTPPRYRHPIDPVLLILTAVTLKTVCENSFKK